MRDYVVRFHNLPLEILFYERQPTADDVMVACIRRGFTYEPDWKMAPVSRPFARTKEEMDGWSKSARARAQEDRASNSLTARQRAQVAAIEREKQERAVKREEAKRQYAERAVSAVAAVHSGGDAGRVASRNGGGGVGRAAPAATKCGRAGRSYRGAAERFLTLYRPEWKK
jgi:hypothetical protein